VADKRVTIRDVAQAIGVHHSTVSLALADDPRITPETKSRVMEAAKELGYSAHHAARALRKGRYHTIALLHWDEYPFDSHVFFNEIMAGITRICANRDQLMVLVPAGVGRNGTVPADKLLLQTPTDGAVLVGGKLQYEALKRLAIGGYPMVHLGERHVEGIDLPFVSGDWQHGAYLATEHLLAQGHRRIAFVYLPDKVGQFLGRRRAGWEEALRNAGVNPDPTWVIPCGEKESDAAACLEALRAGGHTAAIFAFHRTARAVLQVAAQAGLAIPQDLAVVAFDEVEGSDRLNPPLTTVAQSTTDLTKKSVEMLLDLIEGIDPGERHLRIPMWLNIRASSTVPR